jgi:hypothetical protein
MGGLVCAAHRRKIRGFPTLKRTLNLGIEKGRLLKNSRPKGGLIQVICYPTSPETVDITGFFKKFCIAIRTMLSRGVIRALAQLFHCFTCRATAVRLSYFLYIINRPKERAHPALSGCALFIHNRFDIVLVYTD